MSELNLGVTRAFLFHVSGFKYEVEFRFVLARRVPLTQGHDRPPASAMVENECEVSMISLKFDKRRLFLFNSTFCLALIVPCLLGIASCSNAFSEFAKRDTDEALLYEAQMHTDRRDWGAAISAVQSMSAAGQASRQAKYTLASAYAGRCGLELISLADSIANGAGNLWPKLLTAMRTAGAPHVADCVLAETTLMSIGGFSSLTAEEAVLLAFVEFGKMGAVLAASGIDSDDDGAVGPDPFDACVNTGANITDAMVQQLGTGITIAASALAASGTQVASGAVDCSALGSVPGLSGFCSQTSPSDFDAAEILALRALIKSNNAIGFNTCGGDVGTGTCTCP